MRAYVTLLPVTRRETSSETPLQRVVTDYLADHPRESITSIARRGGMRRTTLQSLITRASGAQRPRDETIRQLAKGLGLSVATVSGLFGLAPSYAASEQDLADDLRVLLDLAQKLTPEQRQAVIRRARALEAEGDAD